MEYNLSIHRDRLEYWLNQTMENPHQNRAHLLGLLKEAFKGNFEVKFSFRLLPVFLAVELKV